MRKFILTESEKNEIKSLYRSKGLLVEASDPKNADSYPDKDNWRLQDWQTFYLALKKKWGDRNKARAQFLRYWEPLEKSWMDEPAQDEMDNDNSFFRLEGMWNEKEKRPFTQKEFEEASKDDRCVSGDCNNGKGFMEYADGRKYQGDFNNGELNGKGTFTWTDGTKYEGDFKDDLMDGKGIKEYADGTKYEGDWKNGLKDGKGTYTWTDGSKYEGDWKNGMINGKGTYTNSKGVKFTGDFVDESPIGTNWDTLDALTTQEEANQLMNQIASGASEPAPPGEPDADTSSGSSSSTTTDTSDCNALMEKAKKQSNYNPCNLKNGKVVIGKGNQGALVKMMQCFLNQKNDEYSLGLTELKVDGKFGDKTKEMTIKFQEQFPDDLKSDGIIGKNTYSKFEINDGC